MENIFKINIKSTLMENNRKEYSENNSEDIDKTAAEYGNSPKRMNTDNSGNKSFEKSPEDYPRNSTTGSGYSESERDNNDSTNSQNPANPYADNGSQELVDKYNINDKAYSDSSKKDFVETVSKFHHADEEDDSEDKENIKSQDQ